MFLITAVSQNQRFFAAAEAMRHGQADIIPVGTFLLLAHKKLGLDNALQSQVDNLQEQNAKYPQYKKEW